MFLPSFSEFLFVLFVLLVLLFLITDGDSCLVLRLVLFVLSDVLYVPPLVLPVGEEGDDR